MWPRKPLLSSEVIAQNRRIRLTCLHPCWHAIGHFRVPFCLSFKARLSAKPFLWKWLWFAWKWNCMQNSFSYERFRPYTRFETEAQGNSEMAYSNHVMIQMGGYHCSVSTHTHAISYAWQIAQLQPPKWINTCSELGGNNDINTLAESVYEL